MKTTEITDLKKTLKKCVVYLETIEMLAERIDHINKRKKKNMETTGDLQIVIQYKDMATLCKDEVVSLLSTVYGNI